MRGQAMSWQITISSSWLIIVERKQLVAAAVIQHRRQCPLLWLPSIQNIFVIFVLLAVLNLQDLVLEHAHLDIRRLQQGTTV